MPRSSRPVRSGTPAWSCWATAWAVSSSSTIRRVAGPPRSRGSARSRSPPICASRCGFGGSVSVQSPGSRPSRGWRAPPGWTGPRVATTSSSSVVGRGPGTLRGTPRCGRFGAGGARAGPRPRPATPGGGWAGSACRSCSSEPATTRSSPTTARTCWRPSRAMAGFRWRSSTSTTPTTRSGTGCPRRSNGSRSGSTASPARRAPRPRGRRRRRRARPLASSRSGRPTASCTTPCSTSTPTRSRHAPRETGAGRRSSTCMATRATSPSGRSGSSTPPSPRVASRCSRSRRGSGTSARSSASRCRRTRSTTWRARPSCSHTAASTASSSRATRSAP